MSSRGDGRIYKRRGSSRYWIQYSIRGRQYREPGAKTPAAARKKLRQRLREAGTERFGGPAAERVSVDQLADALLVHLKNQGRASVVKIRCHLKPVRAFFAGRPAMDVTTALAELLAGVSPEEAAAHAIPEAHSIWDLVLRLTAWSEIVRTMLHGAIEHGAYHGGQIALTKRAVAAAAARRPRA